MNRHVTAWLGAYHDGELKGPRLRPVETHLAHCEPCRAELDRLRALAHLLQASPPAGELTPPERFVVRVRLRLPPRPARTAWMGWGGNAAAQWLPSTQDLWLAPFLSSLPIPGLEVGTVLQLLGDGWLSSWSFVLQTVLLVVIGLLYWSWLASWWVCREHRQA